MRSACPWPWKLHNSPLARGGAVFGGGKGGSGGTTYQTQQTTIPPEVQARYNAVNARAEQVAQQPFQPYQGQFVAPLTATQQAGTAQIANAGQGYQPYQQAATTALTGSAEAALPYYGQAGQNIGAAQAAGAPYTGAATMAGLAGAQSVNPGQLDIGRYMDPYLQSVVAPTMQGLYQQQQQQQSQLMGSQAMRGAFGGDRGSIAAANLARQQGLAAQQAQGGLLSQGYGQALQAAQQQQGVGLGAEQANRAAMQQLSPQLLQIGQQAFQQPMAAAQAQQGLGQGLLGYGQGVSQSLAGLGQMGTQTGLASGQALLGAGTLEQQTQQQLNAALYNQYQQQQGYPFQVAQFLANIAMGTGPLYGSTTSGVTGQPTPFFSDERVKEDITEIGRTHDGQKIIKFKYKGSNQPQIGLSAQDVEKHHPEAVSETPEGIKAVDYDMATEHAERPHAYAGGLMPSSEGGAVHPSMAGLGFASGGTPVPGANPEVDEMLRGLAPRRGFADGGEAALMRKLYPWGAAGGLGGGTPGASGAWSPGLTVKPQAPLGSGAQLKAPAPQPTGLSQTIDAVERGLGAAENAEKLAKSGKKAYDWVKDQFKDPAASMEALATSTRTDQAATGEARGGRIGYDDGGAIDESPAIPGGGDDTVLGQLTKKQITPAKLSTHNLSGGAGGGGGGGGAMGDIKAGLGAANSAVNIASSLSKMFAAHGGRIGYDEGGEVADAVATPPDLPEHKLDMSGSVGGGKKDTTAKDALGLAGTLANFIPGVGPVVGAGLKAASMFAKDGGRIDIEHAKGLISRVESGGNYNAMGPLVRGDRAHGKYQVMGANIPSWTEEALGRRMTPAEFLKSPEAQERVFEHHFGKYLNQHGNLADAASMWHSGRPLAKARADGARDVNMSTEDYVRKVIGGGAPAEAHMRTETPSPQRSAGLAPPLHEAEPMDPVPEDDSFEMHDPFDRFAAGGLVGRHGYQTDGAVRVIDPDQVDPNNPEQVEILRAQMQRATGTPPAARPAPTPAPTGVVTPPAPSDPNRITTTPLPPPTGPANPSPKDRDFLDRAGDWYDRNQNWVLPAVSGIGKMLASPSPYLGVAIGQGLAEAAPNAMAANFKQQGLDISKQRTDVTTAEAIQRQIWEAQSQRINVLKNDASADVSSYNDIIKRLTSKLYALYGVPGEGLAMSTPQRSSGPLGQLHPSLDVGFMYQQLAGASPEERTRITAQIEAAKTKIASGQPLLAADGYSTIVPDENLKKQLDIETAKVEAGIRGQTGNMLPAERRGILDDQYKQLDKLISEKEMALGQPNLPPATAELLRGQVRALKTQRADIVRQLGVNQMPPSRLPRQTGGRVAMQAGGNPDPFAPVNVEAVPVPPNDPGALVPRILNPMTSEPVRKQYEEQYKLLTPQQKTPSGTAYRLNPLAGTTPDATPDPEIPPMTPGSLDPRTGAVNTSIPVLPHSKTGGFPSDPGLPKQPHILEGTDSYYDTAQKAAATQEEAFTSRATGQQADINMASMLKFANALKVVEAGGLTTDKARVANMLRGLGLGPAADIVQRETDTQAAYIAAKTALDSAIQKTGTSFATPTQSQFERVASDATPSANIPGGASVALLKENMAQQLWQNALRDDWNKAREQGARNFSSFVDRWRQAHPPGLFREAADRLLGNVKGGELPPLGKLTEGVVYVVPKDMGDHKLKAQIGAAGLRPGDLFVLRDIEHSVDPETKKERFKASDLQRVDPDKSYEVHSGAPGLRFKRPQ